MKTETTDLHKKLAEIAYLGAFYGMRAPSADIFSFLRLPAQTTEAQVAGVLGDALIKMAGQEWDAAALEIEKFIDKAPQPVPPELKIFLVLAYKKAQKRSDRVSSLLEEVSSLPKDRNGVVHHAAKMLHAE